MKWWKVLVLGSVILLMAYAPVMALAQYDSGACPLPRSPSCAQPGGQRFEDIPNRGVCRVIMGTGPQLSVGSGAAISGCEEWTAILTARHVVEREGAPVKAVFADGTTLTGKVAAVSRECDAAVVVVNGKAPQLVAIATDPPKLGQTVYGGGFDGTHFGWQGWRGTLIRQSADGDYIISGAARQGDSGGPVWTSDGLVGVIWGTDQRETVCTSLPKLANFFTSSRYVFPWNAWLADRKDAREHGQVLPPQGMPGAPRAQLPQVPESPAQTVPGGGVPIVIGQDSGRISALESRLATLEGKLAQLERSVATLQEKNGAALDKADSVLGVAQEAQKQAKEAKEHASGVIETALSKSKEYLTGVLAPLFGGHAVLTIVVIGVLFWLIRKDIKNRMATGDPLEAEKLLKKAAAFTPTTIDDWLVDKLSKALDIVMPRPTEEQQVSNGKNRKK